MQVQGFSNDTERMSALAAWYATD